MQFSVGNVKWGHNRKMIWIPMSCEALRFWLNFQISNRKSELHDICIFIKCLANSLIKTLKADQNLIIFLYKDKGPPVPYDPLAGGNPQIPLNGRRMETTLFLKAINYSSKINIVLHFESDRLQIGWGQITLKIFCLGIPQWKTQSEWGSVNLMGIPLKIEEWRY